MTNSLQTNEEKDLKCISNYVRNKKIHKEPFNRNFTGILYFYIKVIQIQQNVTFY